MAAAAAGVVPAFARPLSSPSLATRSSAGGNGAHSLRRTTDNCDGCTPRPHL